MRIDRLALIVAIPCLLAGCSGGAEPEPAPEPAEAVAEEAPRELLPNAIEPGEGLLVGGQPSADQLAALAEEGYATIVSLRRGEEGGTSGDEVEALGMTWVELPIAGSDGLTEENARAFAALLDEIERPAVIHCGSGNRVGALFALAAYHVDGVEAEEALEIGLESGLTGLEPAVREHLGLPAEP